MRPRGWWLGALVIVALLAVSLPVLAEGSTSTTIGKDVVLGPGERMDDDLVVLGGSARLREGSVVLGNLTAVGSETVIEGRVSGDVVALGGSTRLAATAVIDGDLVVFGTVRREHGAVVRGNVIEGGDAFLSMSSLSLPAIATPAAPAEQHRATSMDRAVRTLREIGRRVGLFVLVVLAAALIAALLPDPLSRTAEVMRTSWALSLGMGLLTLVLAALLGVISAVLILICVGIPLALFLASVLLIGSILGWVAAGRLIGQYLGGVFRLADPSLLIETVLGTATLTFLALLPCIGPIVTLAGLCWGLGGAAIANVAALRDLPNHPFRSQDPLSSS